MSTNKRAEVPVFQQQFLTLKPFIRWSTAWGRMREKRESSKSENCPIPINGNSWDASGPGTGKTERETWTLTTAKSRYKLTYICNIRKFNILNIWSFGFWPTHSWFLLLALCSGITPGMLRGPYREQRSGTCKASA